MSLEHLDRARRAYEHGRERLDAGDFPAAIAHFEASIDSAPHFKALELLREARLRNGEPALAIVPLAAATTLNAQVRAPSLLAEALLATGDTYKAYEIACVALAREPNNAKAKAVRDATEAAYRAHHFPDEND